jgi:putative effector of murein hydrolase LrgA (UPF0299 family)
MTSEWATFVSDLLDKVARNLSLLLVVIGVSIMAYMKIIDGNVYLQFATGIVGYVLGSKAVAQGAAAVTAPPSSASQTGKARRP